MTDLELLRKLTSSEDRLTEREEEAFWNMRGGIEAKAFDRLTQAQRLWAERVYKRLELDADDAENLYSRGVVPVGQPVAVPEVLKQLPKKPPGR